MSMNRPITHVPSIKELQERGFAIPDNAEIISILWEDGEVVRVDLATDATYVFVEEWPDTFED